jgi:hypothetical protein
MRSDVLDVAGAPAVDPARRPHGSGVPLRTPIGERDADLRDEPLAETRVQLRAPQSFADFRAFAGSRPDRARDLAEAARSRSQERWGAARLRSGFWFLFWLQRLDSALRESWGGQAARRASWSVDGMPGASPGAGAKRDGEQPSRALAESAERARCAPRGTALPLSLLSRGEREAERAFNGHGA